MTLHANTAARQLNEQGYCILPGLFSRSTIESFREVVLAHKHLMGQTRNNVQSFHLAGFDRFAPLQALHCEIAASPGLQNVLRAFFAPSDFHTIGLTDITINRSQHWHTDLLRGRFSHFLDAADPWAPAEPACVKALVYLQDGKSLKIVPGSHLAPTPLDDAALEQLAQQREAIALEARAGDIVMIDLRALHRGSTDGEMQAPGLAESPKILVSTVFGSKISAFAAAMQRGNAQRMAEWDAKYLA